MNFDEFLNLFPDKPRQKTADGLLVICPGHDDRKPSLSVKLGDHTILLHDFGGCNRAQILAVLNLSEKDLYLNGNSQSTKVIAEYRYCDESNKLLYIKERLQPKSFRFKVPDENGGFRYRLNGVSQTLFSLQNRRRLLEAGCKFAVVVEGEKASLRLQSLLGDRAWVTCTGGAEGWRSEFTKFFEGFQVVACPDNDAPGKKLADKIAKNISKIKILELPEIKIGEDPFDWCERGGTSEEFFALLEQVEIQEPAEAKKTTQEIPVLKLAQGAYYGVVGEFVKIVGPHSEADPIGLLLSQLVRFGNVVGRQPHCKVEDDYHALNLFTISVGKSSKGRKGTGEGRSRRLYSDIEPEWLKNCVKSGISSGEGIIYHVRDPIYKPKEGILKLDDPGLEDKRLLIFEPEFASILRILPKEGSKISSVIREAWDTGDLSNLNKNSSIKATGAHISIIGHITEEELRRYLNETELANGFANRFLFAMVQRSKVLPEGGNLPPDALKPVAEQLRKAIQFAKTVYEIKRDDEAKGIWKAVYPTLSEGKPGLFGSVVSRGEAQVLRLSAIYALLDLSSVVKKEHLLAALAVWEYCEATAKIIFGDMLGDPLADAMLRGLRNSPDGLSRTDISNLFSRHTRSNQIGSTLGLLLEKGLVRVETRETSGRSSEVWYAA